MIMSEPTVAVIVERLDNLKENLSEVLTQVKYTNGRVTRLENWKSMVLGIVIGSNTLLAALWAVFTFLLK